MGGICCAGQSYKDVKEKRTESVEAPGSLTSRGCTDCPCIVLFIAHWVVFVMVVSLGFSDGNPRKLFMPRDYQGAYCGVETQWNTGPDLKNVDVQTYTMNVTSVVDLIAKETACSDAADEALKNIANSGDSATFGQAQYAEYLCACCKLPCGGCSAAFSTPGGSAAAVSNLVSSKMSELTNPASTGLFGSDSANGDMFATLWEDATKNFNKVCSTSCNAPKDIAPSRNYTFMPAGDRDYYVAWKEITTNVNVPSELQALLANQFTFQALGEDVCPYPASKCVPMPGVEFTKVTDFHCTFAMGAAVVDAVGAVAANAIEGNAVSNFASSSTESFGEWVGEIEACILGIIVTCFCSFVIGLVFLILLRFFIGVCVYSSIGLVFLMFLAGGALCFVRSGQCNGTGLLESGKQTASAASSVGEQVATSTVESGSLNLAEAFASEGLSGNGQSYRGIQEETISGKSCVAWANQTFNVTLQDPDVAAAYGLEKSYCRNPVDGFYTIWCYTSDPDVMWETCLPIGMLQPECIHGYQVEGETARDVLKYCAYILWVFAVLWLIAIWCFRSKIKLAIAVNKVAAQFIYNTPQILVVPLVQVIVGIVWCLMWALCACFLISQVPDDRTSKAAYVTYAEAYGSYDAESNWQVGACIGDWPTGAVWKDEDSCDMVDGASACWKCYPPRFIMDYRFAYIFFSFLWNNAMFIACGQIIIAGAVGIWFFTKHSEKSSTYKVGKSIWWLFRYHAGSAAFGSLILAIVQFIRYLMMYFEQQAKVQKNKVMEIALKIGQCIIACLERCIKFLNKNAYIQVALKGTNFCRSAMTAFSLIFRNFVRFGIVATLSAITERIGIMLITISTTTLGYLIVKTMHPHSNPVVPCVLFVFVGYMVAKLYMAVFLMAVDCALQCFIMVEETGGEPADEGEKYVPGPLVKLVPTSKE